MMLFNILHHFTDRLKGKNWRHNRMFPPSFRVSHTSDHQVKFTYKNQRYTFPKAVTLSNKFSHSNANLVLSGPSIKSITQPSLLNRSFCFAVNGSPAFFNEHQIPYDAYVADDPRYLEQYGLQAIKYAQQASYVFLSYRSIFLLMQQGLNLAGLNIYVFDYQFMPFRQYRPTPVKPFFASNLSVGLGKSDTIAHIALQLAHGMGFAQVALFGLDLTMGGRFYDEANPAPQYLHDNWDKGIVAPFMLVRDVVQNEHWPVFNCSPDSLLDTSILPKCEPNQYLLNNQVSSFI